MPVSRNWSPGLSVGSPYALIVVKSGACSFSQDIPVCGLINIPGPKMTMRSFVPFCGFPSGHPMSRFDQPPYEHAPNPTRKNNLIATRAVFMLSAHVCT